MAVATAFFGVHGIGGEDGVEHVGGVDLGARYREGYVNIFSARGRGTRRSVLDRRVRKWEKRSLRI